MSKKAAVAKSAPAPAPASGALAAPTQRLPSGGSRVVGALQHRAMYASGRIRWRGEAGHGPTAVPQLPPPPRAGASAGAKRRVGDHLRSCTALVRLERAICPR